MPQIPLIIEADPDDPDCAAVMVDGTVAGQPYRFVLDTGAARTQLVADEYTSALAATPDGSSFGVFAAQGDPVVTVTDVAVGSLRAATLDVRRVSPGGPRLSNLLGMDVLRRCRCLFRLESAVLEVEPPAGGQAGHDLRMDASQIELPPAHPPEAAVLRAAIDACGVFVQLSSEAGNPEGCSGSGGRPERAAPTCRCRSGHGDRRHGEVANYRGTSATIKVINESTHRVMRTFTKVPVAPDGLAIDSRTRTVLATGLADHFQLLSEISGKVIRTITIRSPTAVAVDENTGNVYVASWNLANPLAVQFRL